jgi:hypothetical protein
VFLFLATKNFAYGQEGLWGFNDPDMNMILAAQLFLVLYLGFAIVLGLFFLKKIVLILNIIKEEFSVLKNGFVQLSFLRRGC